MMKQSKNKKGRLAKSTLSVVLAASMVMTSSSFVWASPEAQEIQVLEAEQVGAAPVDKAWNADGTEFVSSVDEANAYQWKLGEEVVSGSEAKQFGGALTADDVGKTLMCIAAKNNVITTDTFNITNAKITAGTIKASDGEALSGFTYNGSAHKYENDELEVKITAGIEEKTLTADDFVLSFTSDDEGACVDAGEITVTATPTLAGYELGEGVTISGKYTIDQADLSNYNYKFTDKGDSVFTKDDEEVKPVTGDLNLVNKGNEEDTLTLTDGSYDVEYSNNKTASKEGSKASITRIAAKSGAKNFKNAINEVIDGEFSIRQKDSNFTAEAVEDQPYTGADVKPEPDVTDDDDYEVVSSEYTIEYPADASSLGKKTATIKSEGINYTSSTEGTFDYTVVANTKAVASIEDSSYPYTGSPIEPKIVFKDENQESIAAVKGVDYEVKYADNTNVGTATATVTFKGGLAGSNKGEAQVLTFKITAAEADPDAGNFVVDAPKNQKYTYDGSKKTAAVTSVKFKTIGQTLTLKEGTDYEIKVVDGKNLADGVTDAGTYTAKVVGLGNYKDATLGTVSFTIDPAAFSVATLDVTANVLPYTGVSAEPTFKVVHRASQASVDESNYTVTPLDSLGNKVIDGTFPTATGTHKAVLESKGGNFQTGGQIYVEYTIGKSTLENAIVILDHETFTYDPSLSGQVAAVEYVGFSNNKAKALIKSTDGTNGDYKIVAPDLKDCKNVGTYTIKIVGLNNYAGQSKEVTFKITEAMIDKTMVAGKVTAGTTHAGTMAAPYAEITYNDKVLVEGTDYDLVNDAANKQVTITGKGNYKTASPIKESYTQSSGLKLSDPSIQAVVSGTYTYDGTAKEPKIDDIVLTEIYEGGSFVLRKGTDYDTALSYEDNTDAGKGIIIINGKGSYTGERRVEFDIIGIDITADYKIDTAALDRLNIVYDGKDHKNDILKAVKVLNTKTSAVLDSGSYEVKILQDGKEVTEAVNPGTYTVNVYGSGDYSGTLAYQVTIAGVNLGTVANIPSKLDDQVYTGAAITPEVTVTSKSATLKLVKDTDYTVSYLNNIEAGTAYAVVQGAGIYGGTYLVPFAITATDIKDAVVTVAEGTYTYNGKAQTPAVTVKLGDVVIDAANYDVSYEDNTNAGTATVTVTGKNGYTGTPAAAAFVIAKADQKLAVSKTITDALKIRNTNANSYTLKVTGADTKLTYKSSDEKIASVNSAGKIAFKHVCGKATITVTAAADDNYNAATLKVAVAVKPATPKITITARAKGFNAKATAVRDITGYQVGYSTDKNFAAAKTIKKLVKTTKALDKNFSGLAAKKGYYVRVRAYKKVGSTVYWGNWTSAKKITTK